MITRCYLSASTAAIPGTPCLAFAEDVMRLRAEPVNPDLLPGKSSASLWEINGSTPAQPFGPKRGRRVRVRFDNAMKRLQRCIGNVATDRVFSPELSGVNGKRVAMMACLS